MRKGIYLGSLVLLLVGAAAAPGFEADTESEWDQGSFVDAETVAGNLTLVSTGLRELNSVEFPAQLQDVTRSGGYLYTISKNSVVRKHNESDIRLTTPKEWSVNLTGSQEGFIDFHNGRLYATNEDAIFILYPSNGTIIDKITAENFREIEVTNDGIYSANTSGNGIFRYDRSTLNLLDSFSSLPKKVSKGEIEEGPSGDIYFMKQGLSRFDPQLTRKYTKKSGVTLEGGDVTSNYIYSGSDPGYVYKFFLNGTQVWRNLYWPSKPGNKSIDVIEKNTGEIYVAGAQEEDTIYKVAANGSEIYRQGLPESPIELAIDDEILFSAGVASKSSPNNGVLEKLTDGFPSEGTYTSQVFDAGQELDWNRLEGVANLNGQSGEVTVNYSDDAFSTVKSTESFNLGDGSFQRTLSASSRYIRFGVDLNSNQNFAPEVDFLNISGVIFDTEILDPPTAEYVMPGFQVNVSDQGNLSSCSYRARNSAGASSWRSRTCDSPLTVDSDLCSERGYNTCEVEVRITTTGGDQDFDSRNFSIGKKSCSNTEICYPLDTGSGQTIFDRGGKSRDLWRGRSGVVETEDPEWLNSTCYRGSCLNFTEALDDETISKTKEQLDAENLTVSAWVNNKNETSVDWIFTKASQVRLAFDGNEQLFAGIWSSSCGGWCGNDSVLEYGSGLSPPIYFESGYKPSLNEWHRVTLSWNGTHAEFYVDGSRVASETSGKVTGYSPVKDRNSNISIGFEPVNNNHAKFTLDEVRLFKEANAGLAFTSITSPPNGSGQSPGFSVEVTDRSNILGASTCEYRTRESGSEWSVWQSRSCDSSFSVSSTECSVAGVNTCRVEVSITDPAGFVSTDSRNFSIVKDGCPDALACYRMNTGTGQEVLDGSGNGYTGVLGFDRSSTADPSRVSGCKSDRCVQLDDANNERVTVGNLPANEQNLSVSVEVNASYVIGPPQFRTILSKNRSFALGIKKAPGNKQLLGSVYSSSECGGWCGTTSAGGQSWYQGGSRVPENKWTSLTVNFNGTHIEFFENGARTSTKKVSSSAFQINNAAEPFVIGSEEGSNSFKGRLDNVSIYEERLLSGSGTVSCSPRSEGTTANTGPGTDEETCVETPSGSYDYVDQDRYESACLNYWVTERQVNSTGNAPHPFSNGTDDDFNSNPGNYTSEPGQSSWNFNDESPVPTGETNDQIDTLGFCLGDDLSENKVTQVCNSPNCRTDRSVVAASGSPDDCALNFSDVDVDTSASPVSTEVRLVEEGTSVPLADEKGALGCYGGSFYSEWPIVNETASTNVTRGRGGLANFRLINVENRRREFRLELDGPASNFSEFRGGRRTLKVEVPPGSSEPIAITVEGVAPVDGNSLIVRAESLTSDYSGESRTRIDLVDRPLSGAEPRSIPGIGPLQFILLGAVASFVYLELLS